MKKGKRKKQNKIEKKKKNRIIKTEKIEKAVRIIYDLALN